MEALLDATVRTTIGKNEARRTRREGKVPAIVYGASSAKAAAAMRCPSRSNRRRC